MCGWCCQLGRWGQPRGGQKRALGVMYRTAPLPPRDSVYGGGGGGKYQPCDHTSRHLRTCGRMYSGRCMSASSLSTPQPVAMLRQRSSSRL